MDRDTRIFVAGHRGMVGSALVRALGAAGFTDVLTTSRAELDLRDGAAVAAYFRDHRPEVVFMAAAKIGGIAAHRRYAADFLHENLTIQNNVIHHSSVANVKCLVLIGSSCVYPRECPQPMKEEYLLTGPLEPTTEPYAIAKIAGIRLSQSYNAQYSLPVVNPMPTNLYGTNDNYDPEYAQVVASLVKRFSDAADEGARTVTVWGSGSARREFMHVDDCARAILFLSERWESPEIVNVGTGSDVSIKELAELIAAKTGFHGEVRWDTSKPDGMPRKLLDVSRLRSLGFRPEVTLEKGIERTIDEYRQARGRQT